MSIILLELIIVEITGRFPVPDALNPVKYNELVVAVHAKLEPVTPIVQFTAVVADPEQIVCDKTVFVTLGVGLIVTKKEALVPTHELYVGVTFIVPLIALFVVFAGAFHDAIFPTPEAPKPIAVVVFVHAKDCADGLLVKTAGEIGAPGQTVIGVNPVTKATGFTNT